MKLTDFIGHGCGDENARHDSWATCLEYTVCYFWQEIDQKVQGYLYYIM